MAYAVESGDSDPSSDSDSGLSELPHDWEPRYTADSMVGHYLEEVFNTLEEVPDAGRAPSWAEDHRSSLGVDLSSSFGLLNANIISYVSASTSPLTI